MEKSYKEFLEEEEKRNKSDRSMNVRSKDRTDLKFHKRKYRKPPKKYTKVTYTTEKEFDFMKYYIIVEHYFLKVVFAEYELTPKDFKFLLFLYSEPPFTRTDFNDFAELLMWDKYRVDAWKNKGIIEEYTVKKHTYKQKHHQVKLYNLTRGVKLKIRNFYDKLVLRHKISEYSTHNPLFRVQKRTYTDKRYAKKIKQMNAGKFGKNKTEEDWQDLSEISFREYCEKYNEHNDETMFEDMQTVKDLAKEKKERI